VQTVTKNRPEFKTVYKYQCVCCVLSVESQTRMHVVQSVVVCRMNAQQLELSITRSVRPLVRAFYSIVGHMSSAHM